MGAQRKTTAELERKGAFDKNPARGRDRAAEPVPIGELGPPPESFLRDSKLLEAWNELLEETKDILLTNADRGHFEMTARLRVRCRSYRAKTGDFAQLNKYQSQLGLNPASRSLVHGKGKKTQEDEESDWEDLASGGTGIPVQ